MPPFRWLPWLTRLHTWVGVLLALPLLLLATSGTLLVFKDNLFLPAELQARGSVPTNDQLGRLLASLPPDWATVYVADETRAFHTVVFRDGTEKYVRADAQPGAPRAVLTPPRTAPTPSLEPLPPGLRIENALYRLHTTFFLGEIGKLVVKIAGPLALALLIVGLYVWWPRRRIWRWRDLRPSSPTRPQLMRFHMSLAVASAAFFVCLIVSGALLAHAPTIREWLKPWSARASIPSTSLALLRFTPGDYTQALEVGHEVLPAGELTRIINVSSTDPANSPKLLLRIRLPGEAHPYGRSSVTLNLASGRVEAARDARRGGWPAAYDDWLYPFHTAHLGGAAQRFVWLIAGLALLTTSAAGLLSFTRR